MSRGVKEVAASRRIIRYYKSFQAVGDFLTVQHAFIDAIAVDYLDNRVTWTRAAANAHSAFTQEPRSLAKQTISRCAKPQRKASAIRNKWRGRTPLSGWGLQRRSLQTSSASATKFSLPSTLLFRCPHLPRRSPRQHQHHGHLAMLRVFEVAQVRGDEHSLLRADCSGSWRQCKRESHGGEPGCMWEIGGEGAGNHDEFVQAHKAHHIRVALSRYRPDKTLTGRSHTTLT